MIKFDERFTLGFDWLWLLALVALSGAGILAIWSTTGEVGLHSPFGKQIIYVCCGLLVFLAVLSFDYHFFSDFIKIFYVVGLAVLGLVLIMGHTVHGNKSWLNIGLFQFQPSEIMKIIVIIALAKYYSELEREYLGIRELLIGGAITFVPVLLVIWQKDLGTAITFLPIYAVLSCLAGIKKKHLIIIMVLALAAAPVAWFQMKGYRQGRIETVFNPSNDAHGLGYQSIQSEIAIGSGKFLGKGFKQGSQGRLGFVPARTNDFIFAVIAEEKGFIGAITILGLFLFLSFRLFRTAREAKDKLGSMIVVGALSVLLFHVIINMGMVEGLLPIIGIPLPFVSAGGSSIISYFAAMSLCMGIRMRRYVN